MNQDGGGSLAIMQMGARMEGDHDRFKIDPSQLAEFPGD